tara:strand:+ start:174903 stop:175295 length:393 start_codon:yes stop_codon:yes gene_type:complete
MATPLAEQASQELFDLARQIPELKAHLKESGIIFDDQGWRIHGTNVMNNNGMLCIKGAVAEYLAKLGGFIADFKHEGNWRFSGEFVSINDESEDIAMSYEGDPKARRTSHLTAWLFMANQVIRERAQIAA